MIDIQNDYFSGGTMVLDGMEAAAKNALRLLDFFRAKNKPVFHTQHIATRQDATFFLPTTIGGEIQYTAAPEDGEPVIQKLYPNCFRETPLQAMLEDMEITHLTICGAMSHMCIDSSVRAASDLGFKCRVVSDACATRDLEFEGEMIKASQVHAVSMAALAFAFAEVVKTEDIVNGGYSYCLGGAF